MGIVTEENQVLLSWQGDLNLPPRGYYEAYGSPYGGPVDLTADRLDGRRVYGWPRGTLRKGGFGRGAFGHFAFGHGLLGVGFGHFPFGHGPFGYGTKRLQTTVRRLIDAVWELAVVSFDQAGNAVQTAPPVETVELVVAGTPAPPAALKADGYDEPTDTLSVSFTLSSDDEAA